LPVLLTGSGFVCNRRRGLGNRRELGLDDGRPRVADKLIDCHDASGFRACETLGARHCLIEVGRADDGATVWRAPEDQAGRVDLPDIIGSGLEKLIEVHGGKSLAWRRSASAT
jgi:hypothetical protein